MLEASLRLPRGWFSPRLLRLWGSKDGSPLFFLFGLETRLFVRGRDLLGPLAALGSLTPHSPAHPPFPPGASAGASGTRVGPLRCAALSLTQASPERAVGFLLVLLALQSAASGQYGCPASAVVGTAPAATAFHPGHGAGPGPGPRTGCGKSTSGVRFLSASVRSGQRGTRQVGAQRQIRHHCRPGRGPAPEEACEVAGGSVIPGHRRPLGRGGSVSGEGSWGLPGPEECGEVSR